MKPARFLILFLIFVNWGCSGGNKISASLSSGAGNSSSSEPTPTPTQTPTETPVPTPNPTAKPTPDPTPTLTPVPTPIPTAKPTPVPTPIPTPVATPVPTPTPLPTPQPTPNPTPVTTPPPNLATPADTNASTITKAVFTYLTNLKNQPNHRLISGQWGDWGFVDTALMQRIDNVTGQWAGLVGADYANLNGGFNTTSVNTNMITYWNKGSLIEIDIVFPDPWTGGALDATFGNFADVVTPGTAVYKKYFTYLDTIAAGLQQLQAAGVVVLFRPLMEMEYKGSRWYGGQPDFGKLWIETFNYLTTTKGLHNLLWVWAGSMLAYYPGAQYVDVVGNDTYSYGYCDTGVTPPSLDYQPCVNGAPADYKTLLSTGKLFALSEFGLQTWNFTNNAEKALDLNLGVQNVQKYIPEAVYFMMWSTGATGGSPTWEIDTQLNGKAALASSWIQNAPVPWNK